MYKITTYVQTIRAGTCLEKSTWVSSHHRAYDPKAVRQFDAVTPQNKYSTGPT